MTAEDDPIREAERQMILHELGIFQALFRKASESLGVGSGTYVSDDEVREAVDRLLVEDPDARELARRLVAFQHMREGGC